MRVVCESVGSSDPAISHPSSDGARRASETETRACMTMIFISSLELAYLIKYHN